MADLNQSLFIRAIRRQHVERTPVWVMRQAGRYLPEYRKIREEAGSFLNLCKNPEWACEVTLQPLRRFSLDAAILFSDILTIPDAMGLGLSFVEGEGPCFSKPVRDVQAIHDLPLPDCRDSLSYVMDTVRILRKEMPQELPLIGFAGSPWTLACYMVEGKSSKTFSKLMKLVYTEHQALHLLLKKLALSVGDYLIEQIKAGVNAVMIFDTWGGILTPSHYQTLSLIYMKDIVEKIKGLYPEIPIILFTKGGSAWLESMAASGCDALGIDWTCDLQGARRRVGQQVALQGNLDPSVLLSSKESIREQVGHVLASFGPGSGHVFNLGHGITPDVPPEHLAWMIEAVRELSPSYHLRD